MMVNKFINQIKIKYKINNNQFELFLKHIRLIRIKLKKLQKLVDERKKEITKIENYIERSKQIEELKSKIDNKSKIKRIILNKLPNRKEKLLFEMKEFKQIINS